jgi:hypothetical protein
MRYGVRENARVVVCINDNAGDKDIAVPRQGWFSLRGMWLCVMQNRNKHG